MPALVPRLLSCPTALAVGSALLAAGCAADAAGPVAVADAESSPSTTRTVEHAMGTTEVPADPERVVVLDTGELDSALELGVTPVGAVTTDVSETFLSYLEDDTQDVEVVGTIGEPNLEKIAALDPDLILGNVVRDEERYDELSAIAPTVFAADLGDTWKENFRLAGEALGREEEAEAALAAYEERAAELGASLGDPADTVVSALRFTGGTIRAYRDSSFLGTILSDLGVGRPDLPDSGNDTFAELSPEQLQLGDGDVLLYSSYGSGQESGEEAVVAGALWPRLEAVRSGQAHRVEDDYFYTGIGVGAANLVLDDLEQVLQP